MAEFAIRFPKAEVPKWAKRYAYADDTEVEKIGDRSKLASFYTREDFLTVCEWKTRGRPRRHYQCNSEEDVRRQTAIALTSADEQTRMMALRNLRGVSWATASVLLHLAHKEPYPILDFRALWSLRCERTCHSLAFWRDYVQACRILAAECGVSMRDLDRALWQYSKENQREKKCNR